MQDVDRLKKDTKLKVLDGAENRTIFIGLDQFSDELKYSNVKGKNPFKDIRVRKALNLAVDREAIRRVTMRGLVDPGRDHDRATGARLDEGNRQARQSTSPRRRNCSPRPAIRTASASG